MLLQKPMTISGALLLACLSSAILAADASRTADVPKAGKKQMRMHDPMSTKMMKSGMKKGDVKKDADKRAQDMKPMLDQEEKSMERGKRK